MGQVSSSTKQKTSSPVSVWLLNVTLSCLVTHSTTLQAEQSMSHVFLFTKNSQRIRPTYKKNLNNQYM